MFGYVPQFGDLNPRHMNHTPVPRTKSRTYQMACWSAWLGGHDFFLGRTFAGAIHYAFTIAMALSWLYSWQLFLSMVALNASWCVLSIPKIALSRTDDPIYSGCTPSWFFPSMRIVLINILWGLNFWKNSSPADGTQNSD